MAVSLRQLEATVGEAILPKWRMLLAWARSRRFVAGDGITWRETPDGVVVRVARRRGYPHPFRVGLSAEGFRIRPGLLDGDRVTLDGRYLDGEDVRTRQPGTVPVLPVGRAPKEPRSWVVLRRAGEDTAATVAHVHEPDPEAQPLALVLWQDEGPQRVLQIVRHNLRSAAATPREDGSRAVFFWAV